ncbi:cyclin-dependent kinase [Blastocystis sp. ATCC 50177/Nand II]|uniref:Cyclin-dependent kinase 2 homolog n=1 Tax=Blastocystis sp. subtype 1 (strain ATCC 50177 / NandII) TaxID=478820 RepID=A0A196SAN9_BLAHN|nr:cyclin-dependent kinase [Blastocystis sp. ATCC 50177/Nand II]
MEDYAIEGYKLLDRIGEGTYGDVYKAVSLADKKVYAIKFIRFRETSLSNGVSLSTIREIRFLKSTDNKNIVKLFRIVSPDVNEYMKYSELKPICMVMDYVEHDMWGLLQLAKELKLAIYSPIHVKWYMFQILSALSYLHSNMILHRDLKTSNILVTNNHVVKLTDFGLARKLKYGGDQRYTTVVMTLWYRPPELLLGESHYGCEADIWSAGCIFGELLVGSPIFPTHSDNEVEELHVIFKSCGTPDDNYILHLLQSKNIEMKSYPPNLKNYLTQRSKVVGTCNPSWITDEVMDLLLQMLQISPSKRKTADELLQHPYFDEVRDHPPDIPPFAPSLDTHRFQVKSRVHSTRSGGAPNPPSKNGLGVFEGATERRAAPGLRLNIGSISVPPGANGRREALPSPFASAATSCGTSRGTDREATSGEKNGEKTGEMTGETIDETTDETTDAMIDAMTGGVAGSVGTLAFPTIVTPLDAIVPADMIPLGGVSPTSF